MSDQLKPCPFCGGEAEVERRGTTRQSQIYVCQECGCRLETGETFGVEHWNRRAIEGDLTAAQETADRARARARQLKQEIKAANDALAEEQSERDLAHQVLVKTGRERDDARQERDVARAALEQIRRVPASFDGPQRVFIECPCCGDVAAEGFVNDGDPLICGCNGIVSMDAESEPDVTCWDGEPCPKCDAETNQ